MFTQVQLMPRDAQYDGTMVRHHPLIKQKIGGRGWVHLNVLVDCVSNPVREVVAYH